MLHLLAVLNTCKKRKIITINVYCKNNERVSINQIIKQRELLLYLYIYIYLPDLFS